MINFQDPSKPLEQMNLDELHIQRAAWLHNARPVLIELVKIAFNPYVAVRKEFNAYRVREVHCGDLTVTAVEIESRFSESAQAFETKVHCTGAFIGRRVFDFISIFHVHPDRWNLVEVFTNPDEAFARPDRVSGVDWSIVAQALIDQEQARKARQFEIDENEQRNALLISLTGGGK